MELAILFQHDFKMEPGHFFFRIGPSFDFILSGNETYQKASGETIERNMKFSFEDYGYATTAIILQFGYEAKKGFYYYAHYNYGLTSLNNKDLGPKIGIRTAGITIGKYLFKKS